MPLENSRCIIIAAVASIAVPLSAYAFESEQKYRQDNFGVFGQRQHTMSAASNNWFLSGLKKHGRKDFKGAIADYLEALQVVDKDPAVHCYLGAAYQSAGELAKANEQFEIEKQMMQRKVTGLPSRDQDFDQRRTQIYIGGRDSDVRFVPRRGDFGSSQLYFVPGVGLSTSPHPKVQGPAVNLAPSEQPYAK